MDETLWLKRIVEFPARILDHIVEFLFHVKHMELSQAGMAFIQSFEGCILHPYLDSGGTATIGWGCTHYPNGTAVNINDPAITQAQANSMFATELETYVQGVLATVTIVLNQNQLDSLADFTYNCGIGAFQKSTLAQHVNGQCVVEEDFTLYDHIGETVSQELLTRRQAEYQLFIKSINSMENTNTTAGAEVNGGATITAETPQILTIQSVTVAFVQSVAGKPDVSGTFVIPAGPEVIAAVQEKIEAGWNITVQVAQ